jgi:hypothetical protein
MDGNSKKTVAEKLNFKKYPAKLILHAPEEAAEDFKEVDFDSSIKQDAYDMVFIFTFTLDEFEQQLKMVINNKLIKDNGYLFFAYPKKNNPMYDEFIERDTLYQAIPTDEDGYAIDSNLKFSRMVSMNEVFTVVGLKSAPKKATKSASTKKSQRVDDYIVHIDDVKNYPQKDAAIMTTFENLAYGYQKDWARYVYSAKREATQEKRLSEMENALKEGYKSIDLYRAGIRKLGLSPSLNGESPS